MSRRAISPRAAAIIVVACAALWACSDSRDRVEPGRDVVLVVIDTLRADHVGVYEQAPYPATPEIDRLAIRGRWFTETWASAPWTIPSLMSLMTSLEPPVHGLELEGDLFAEAVPVVPPGASTLAEVLQRSGYRTLAVTAGGGAGSAFGFRRGFDRFFEPEIRSDQDVEAGVDLALQWLDEEHDQPLFLFFHTYEVHLPNTHGAFEGRDDPASRAVAAYASDLEVADHHLGRLFSALRDGGRLARSIVVVTSDHGENLHDRIVGGRPVEHGHHLHAELLRVPLIFVAEGLIPASGGIAAPAQLLDVLPTVCSLLGIDVDAVPHQGRDLRPVLQGWGAVEPVDELFAWAPLQGPTWGSVRTPEWAQLVSPRVSTGQWWQHVEVPPLALYDRRSDPGEHANQAQAGPEVARALSRRLDQRRQADLALRTRLGGGPELPSESQEQLRALGYLDRDTPEDHQ